MKKQILMLLSGCLLSLIFCACSTVPYSGRSQLLMTSETEEVTMGASAWKDLQKQEKIDPDQAHNAALKRVGTNISKVVNKPEYKWEFKVFASKTPNAFCLPGGKVGVYSALFDYTANDAELAAVVGHEIAHAIARHGGERMSQGMIQELGAETLKATTKNSQAWQQIYGLTTNTALILPYSRTHEYESDYLGLIFMAQAGYDPRAAVNFWKKFGQAGGSGKFTQYISTHPAGEDRIAEIEKKLPEAMAFYGKASVKHGLGVKYR